MKQSLRERIADLKETISRMTEDVQMMEGKREKALEEVRSLQESLNAVQIELATSVASLYAANKVLSCSACVQLHWERKF